MNPKERVKTAFAHQNPDRVPIDYCANPGIDHRLKEHFGLTKDDDEGLRQALGVDFREVNASYTGPELHEEIPDTIVDIWGNRKRWIEHDSGGYWDHCGFALQNATLEEVEQWPLPCPDDFDYSSVEKQCDEYSDYFIFAGGQGWGDIINGTGMVRTMEQAYIDLITDDPVGIRCIDRRFDILYEIISRTLEAANGKIDMIFVGDDLGTQIAPIISLELFRKHIRSRYQRYVDIGNSFNIPIMFHTCGSSSWVYNDFIDMGIKGVDAVQPEAKDMSPEYLKANFGDKLLFHGCISTAGPVAYGTVDDVIDDVKQKLKIMMPGGGYAFAPTHLLQDNSPTENVVAMYEAAKKYGCY